MIDIVFGASSGYGKGAADVLSRAGGKVLRASRSLGGVDVRYPELVAAFFAKHAAEIEAAGGVRSVIYSAGLAIGKDTVEDGAPEAWREVFETNCLGMMYVAKVAIPFLRKSRGHFIAIGSIATEIAYAGAADYCASKVAQTRVMQALRYELLGSGIRQTILEVGLGDTDFQRRRYAGDMEKAASHYGDIRQLRPEDIGRTILWLLAAPEHVNFDSITLKPLDQAHHGVILQTAKG